MPLPAPEFAYAAGVHVARTSIWCDVARARGVSFLSRADVALGRSAAVAHLVATDRTVRMRRALGLPVGDPLVPRFGRPFALGRTRVELLPAGGLPGGARLHVEQGGWRGLYAGAVLREPARGVEPAQVRACDELVIDAPQAGGVVDPAASIDAALAEGAVLVPADLLTLALLAGRVAPHHLAAPRRWARALGLSRTRDVARDTPRRDDLRRVVAGMRAADEPALALGAGAGVAALVELAATCGARRVHVRLAGLGRDPMRVLGAHALDAALRAHGVRVGLIGPAEQLSLFR